MSLKRLLLLITAAFTLNFLVRGVVVAMVVPHPSLQAAGLVLWLASVALAVAGRGIAPRERAGGNRAPSRLPAATTAAVLTLVIAAAVLLVAASGAEADQPLVATLYGAVGVTLVVVVVRRRPLWAWGGIAALTAIGIAAMGPGHAFGRGLVGAFVWVGVAQLILWSIDRAYLDTARLVRLQQASSAWQATQEIGRRERRRRVRFALSVAGPSLSRVVESGGELTEEERAEALIAEGALRDELRAHRLMDDRMRDAIGNARRRGAAVTVIDDDGLADLDDAELAVVRERLAEALSGTDAARIIVRSTDDPDVAVTVVGRAAPSTGADEDDLVLWREIPRR